MSQFLAIRNGGKTDENGALRFLRRLSSNGQGNIASGDMLVSQHSTPNTTADIAIGDLAIIYQDYIYYAWIDAIYNTAAFGSNSSGSNRIDSVVAYIDLTVVSSSSNNNPGALKFLIVQGTTSAPTGSAIQTAVGSGNPYYVLANVTVGNGFPTSPSTIVNANISDQRTQYQLGSSAKFGFFVPGTAVVANDQSWNPIAPLSQTMLKLSTYCKTAPTTSGLTVQIYNITQANIVATVTISAGSQSASTTSMTNASISAGDVLRCDITAIGSGTPGADVTAILS